ncbi:hypothetical protein [Salinarimonas rosea]|uniref:hypothetical protein n=1 Tax=Salinarimonas rosea TaxID=552063 RepID=UPI0004013E50|nr:hypothetical protein [Salinarimonas rosea]
MSRSLLDKLGWRVGRPWRVLDIPPALAEVVVPPGEPAAAPDWILAFAADRAALARTAPEACGAYRRGGHLWLAYPKRNGRIATDPTRDVGWEPVTGAGFLPVLQVALDETWSALRFRLRDEIPRLTRRA